MTISAQQVERYLDCRTRRGMNQTEAARIAQIGRTRAWQLDKEHGLSGDAVEKQRRSAPRRPRKSVSTAEDTNEIRDAVERLESAGVIPPVGHGAGAPELVIPDGPSRGLVPGDTTPIDEPSPGDVLLVQGERLGTIREFGTRVDEGDPDPYVPHPRFPGAGAVRHLGRESPSDVHRFARLESHR